MAGGPAAHVALGLLAEPDCLALLDALAGGGRVTTEPDAA